MGQDPGILRGIILAMLRIRRTKRLNKTRRPKLRILMLNFGAESSFASSSYPLGSLKDGTRCVRLVNLEYRDASHSTFRR